MHEQHAMPPEFDEKWGTYCLNTKLPLPNLLCAGYNVKLIIKQINVMKLLYIEAVVARRGTDPDYKLFLDSGKKTQCGVEFLTLYEMSNDYKSW